MTFIAGVLTFLIVVLCLLLIFLVLVQLPKKDAGVGMAFGASTADALFGAGSGNVLTKITKYATGIFFVLSLVLGYVQEHLHNGNPAQFEKAVEQQQTQPPQSQTPMAPPATAPTPAASLSTNALILPSTTTATNPPNAASSPPKAPAKSK